VRGLDVTPDCRFVVLTAANEHGFAVWWLDIEQREEARRLFWSESEAWSGIVSADATLVAIDTTDHNPGVRRFAVTVVDARTGDIVATLTDGHLGPVRRVAFSDVAGDPRVLANTERSGWARPVVWNPLTGHRVDITLDELRGDAIALDWDAARHRVLILHNDAGVHSLLEHDLVADTTRVLLVPLGAYADFDTGDVFPMIFSSHYAPNGTIRIVRSCWDVPLHLLELSDDGKVVEVHRRRRRSTGEGRGRACLGDLHHRCLLWGIPDVARTGSPARALRRRPGSRSSGGLASGLPRYDAGAAGGVAQLHRREHRGSFRCMDQGVADHLRRRSPRPGLAQSR
jgi:hypothetical protein